MISCQFSVAQGDDEENLFPATTVPRDLYTGPLPPAVIRSMVPYLAERSSMFGYHKQVGGRLAPSQNRPSYTLPPRRAYFHFLGILIRRAGLCHRRCFTPRPYGSHHHSGIVVSAMVVSGVDQSLADIFWATAGQHPVYIFIRDHRVQAVGTQK